MKAFAPILLLCALAVSSFAEEAKTNAAPAQASGTGKVGPAVATFAASAGVISGPLVLTNGIISQAEQMELDVAGKAIFSFTLTNAGVYVIRAMVNSPDESSNSFFLNVDAQPEDPLMIWDIDPTNGFEERTVSWRGNGDASSDEFAPKRFKLSAGAHKIILVGREPSELKSLSIHPTSEN